MLDWLIWRISVPNSGHLGKPLARTCRWLSASAPIIIMSTHWDGLVGTSKAIPVNSQWGPGQKVVEMASIKNVLKTQAGVTLAEVNLTTPRGVVLATAWEVTSKRTSEVRVSHTIETAERRFAEELARCVPPPGRS